MSPSASASLPAPSVDTLVVCFTGETLGNLLPCPCPDRPLGGLARRVGILRAAPSRHPRSHVLRADAGGFVPVGEVPLRDAPGAAAEFVALLLRGLHRSGVEAVALDHGMRRFLEETAPQATRDLAGVLLDADPPGAPRITSWGARRIALLALEETAPDSALLRAAEAARGRADHLIVLARAEAVSGRRIARLTGADLVVLSRGARTAEPIREGDSWLVGAGAQGKEVGEVHLVLASRNGRLRLEPARHLLRPMDASVPEDAETAAAVARLVSAYGVPTSDFGE